MKDRILLVTGLHANERCTHIVAERVQRRLVASGLHVDALHIPREQTLLGYLDDPDTAMPDYCLPQPDGEVDVDLDGLVGDDALRERYPNHAVFEFHNARDVWSHFGLDPDKPVEDYEVGVVMPVFTRAYEIGTWQNVGSDGVKSKFVIEALERVDARLHVLERLERQGYTVPPKVADFYLKTEADVEATRTNGLLGQTIAGKIADWIAAAWRDGV